MLASNIDNEEDAASASLRVIKLRKFVIAVIVLWSLMSLPASLLGMFSETRSSPPLLFWGGVLLPVLLYVFGYLSSPTFRQLVLSLDLRKIF